jgi:predicted nucleotidyltransferase
VTIDVDVIIEADRKAFYAAERILRGHGFDHDKSTTYRFIKGDLIVDVMPTDPTVLGFSNRWYKQGFQHAETRSVEGIELRHLSFPYFLATKLEAFNGRGNNDYFGSKDMEDIITVLAGRSGFLRELLNVEGDLRSFIKNELVRHAGSADFRESIPGHIPRLVEQDLLARQVIADILEFVGA